jgi:hypothetical protein
MSLNFIMKYLYVIINRVGNWFYEGLYTRLPFAMKLFYILIMVVE